MDTLIDIVVKENGGTGMSDAIQSYLANESGMTDKEREAAYAEIRADIVDEMVSIMTSGSAFDATASLYGAFIEEFITDIKNTLCDTDIWIGMLIGDNTNNPLKDIVTSFTDAMGTSTDAIIDAVTTFLAAKFGSEDEIDGMGHKVSTQGISGVGSANMGVAGAAAITVLHGHTSAVIADRAALLTGADLVISGDASLNAVSTQKIYTTASASSDLARSQALKNKQATSKGTAVGVGASVAFNYIDNETLALVGEKRRLSAASLDVAALLKSDVDAVAVAGSDPIARRDDVQKSIPTLGSEPEKEVVADANSSTAKDISADASVALTLADNKVYAKILGHTVVTTTGANVIPAENDDAFMVNLRVYAREKGDSYTSGSAFAVGGKAAVGATVAVNIVTSDLIAGFYGKGDIAGSALIATYTYNEDETAALATIVGASMDRYLEKLRSGLNFASVGYSPVSNLNATIVGKLNAYVYPVKQKTTTTILGGVSKLPMSSTILKKLGIELPNTDNTVNNTVNNAASDAQVDVSAPQTDASQKGQSINVAAAIGVNYTVHEALTEIAGELTVGGVLRAASDNHANYRTLGTGATVTTDLNANNISTGVAVTVNRNKASVQVSGKADAQGDVTVASTLYQNLDEQYAGLLSAQAIAGSVSAKAGGKVSIAGAVAVQVARAAALAQVADDAIVKGRNLTVSALDKSKIAVRAGSVSVGQQTVGVGASFALIYAENTVTASVGKRAELTGGGLRVTAEKMQVSTKDYQFPFGVSTLFTVDVQEDRDKGIINLHTGKVEGRSMALEIALDTTDLLKLFDLLNFLSTMNYYAEAISGAILTGSVPPTAAVSGAFSMVFAENDVRAVVDESAVLTLTGDLAVRADSRANARVIGGAVSGSKAKVGVGASIGVMDFNDDVRASLAGTVNAGGKVDVTSDSFMDAWIVTNADAVTASTGAGATVGGNINVILTNNRAEARIADNASVTAGGALTVGAANTAKLTEIALSVAISAGTGAGAAVGGTVSVIVTDADTIADVGANALLSAQSVSISAVSDETLYDVLASVSGKAGSSGASVAGTLSVLVANSNTLTGVGANAVVKATAGGLNILADSDLKQIVIVTAATMTSANAAVGATINIGVFNNNVKSIVGDGADLEANGGASSLKALADATAVIVTVAGSAAVGGGSQAAISGAIPVVVSRANVMATMGDNAEFDVLNGGLDVLARLTAENYIIGGAIAGTTGAAGVGATLVTVVENNKIHALAGEGAGLSGDDGVNMNAFFDQTMALGAMGGGAASTAGVGGVITTLVMNSEVFARIGANADIRSGNGGVAVGADEQSTVYNIAGALGGGSTAGVGATVSVLVYDNDVIAEIGDGSLTAAHKYITVKANSDETLFALFAGFGAGGTAGVAGGIGAVVYQNMTKAVAGGTISRTWADTNHNVEITAKSDVKQTIIGGGFSAGGAAGVTGEVGVNVFKNETYAELTNNGKINTQGLVVISADSREDITLAIAGAGAGGTAGVTGSVAVAVSKVVTKATVGDGTRINGAFNIDIAARDKYSMIGVAGGLAAGGAGGVGVAVLVNAAFNTVSASVGARAILRAARNGHFDFADESGRIIYPDVSITASSDRDLDAYVIAGGAGGAAGVGGAVLVSVNGAKMTKNARDEIDKGEIDPAQNLNGAFAAASGHAQGYAEGADISGDLEGDGQDVTQAVGDGGSVKGGDIAEGDDSTLENFAGDKSYKQSAAITDATSATVGDGSSISAARSITLEAKDEFNADLIAGALGAGGAAGVGASVVVGVMNGSAVASAGDDTLLKAEKDILIRATVGAAELPRNTSRDAYLEGMDGIADMSTYTVRAIAVACGGGGTAGVGVALSTLINTARAHATLDGNASNAENLFIEGNNTFGRLAVVTAAGGGGLVGVGVSGAVAVNESTTETAIRGDAVIVDVDAVKLTTRGVSDAAVAVAGIGAGLVGVNANFAVALNSARSDTYISAGASVQAKRVALQTTFSAGSEASLYAVAGGAVGVSASVAVVKNSPVVYTYIGKMPVDGDAPAHLLNGAGGRIAAEESVSVINDLRGDCIAAGASIAGGAVGGNGTVAVSLQRMRGAAVIRDMSVADYPANVSVTALMRSDAQANILGVAAGAVAAGVSVAVAKNDAVNEALVRDAALSVNHLTVSAGEPDGEKFSSGASVDVLTGCVGAVGASVNVGVAVNNARNTALISHSGGQMNVGDLKVYAVGRARADANMLGVNAGAGNITASVALAKVTASQTAALNSASGTIRAASVEVLSSLNDDLSKDAFDADAALLSGAGSLLSATANTATALANAASRAYIDVGGDMYITTGGLSVRSTGRSYAYAGAAKSGLEVAGIGLMVNVAEANGLFDAYLAGKATVASGDLTVAVVYDSLANTVTEPAGGGLGASFSAATVNVNAAVALDAIRAYAAVRDADVIVENGVMSVTVDGFSAAVAESITPSLSVNAYEIAANNVAATADVRQNASIRNSSVRVANDALTIGKALTVRSTLNANRADVAVAKLGGTGEKHPDSKVSLSFASATENSATTVVLDQNKAYITGSDVVAGIVSVISDSTGRAASTVVLSSGGSVKSLGVNILSAYAKGQYEAYIDLTGATLTAMDGDIAVRADSVVSADAVTMQPPGGVTVDGLKAKLNIALSVATAATRAAVLGAGALKASGALTVTALGAANAAAESLPPMLSISAGQVVANSVTALLDVSQSASVQSLDSLEAGSVLVTSTLNGGAGRDAKANAVVGGNGGGGNISLGSATADVAIAAFTAKNRAFIGHLGGLDTPGAVAIALRTDALANAGVNKGSSSTLAGIGVTVTQSDMDGVFEAYFEIDGAGNAKSLTIDNVYNAAASADALQPDGGITAALASINVNSATSDVGLTADASVRGSGSLTLDDHLHIRLNALKVRAESIIESAEITVEGVGIGVNNACATLSGSQSAYIENASIRAFEVLISTLFNADPSLGGGAFAKAGSNGGKKVSLLGGTANIINARGAFVTNNFIRSADIKSLTVSLENGNDFDETQDKFRRNVSRADARALSGDLLSLANVGLMIASAAAADRFNTYILLGSGKTIDTGALTLHGEFVVDVLAVTGAAGSVNVTLGSIELNTASASATARADTFITGAGDLFVSGNARLRAYCEDAMVVARGETAKIALSIISATVNAATAALSISNNAYLQAEEGADMRFRLLEVQAHSRARQNNAGGGAIALVGGSMGIGADEDKDDYTVNIAGASVNAASAISRSSTTASVRGAGSIAVTGTLNVSALGRGWAQADTKTSVKLSLMTLGSLSAEAHATDNTDSSVGAKNLRATSVDITATSESSALAAGQNPGGFVAIEGIDSTVDARVGTSETRRQTAKAYIGDGANVLALNGDITIAAVNNGVANTVFTKDTTVTIITVSSAANHPKAWYTTEAYVGENAVARAERGRVSVTANNLTQSDNTASTATVAYVASVENMYAKNEVRSDVTVAVGRNAAIYGANGVTLAGDASALLTATAEAMNSSFFSTSGTLRAGSDVSRTVSVNIGPGASVVSRAGDINVTACAGQSDGIVSCVIAIASALHTGSSLESEDIVKSYTNINVGAGARIVSEYKTVKLDAASTSAGVSNRALVATDAFVGSVDTYSIVTLTFDSRVRLNSGYSQAGEAQAEIIGNNVIILSRGAGFDVHSSSYTATSSRSNKRAESRPSVNATHAMEMDRVTIRANAGLEIAAAAQVNLTENIIASYSQSIMSYSTIMYPKKAGWFSSEYLVTDPSYTGSAYVNVHGGTKIYALRARIVANDERRGIDAQRTAITTTRVQNDSSAIAFAPEKISFSRATTINGNAQFHIGLGAVGVKVLVRKDIDLFTGGQQSFLFPNDTYGGGESTYFEMLGALALSGTGLGGSLSVYGGDLNGKVFWQRQLAGYEIVNDTALSLHFSENVIMENLLVNAAPTLYATGANRAAVSEITTGIQPELTIVMLYGGDIRLGAAMINTYGTTSFIWEGEERGSLTSGNFVLDGAQAANLWTRHLTVKNALNVGAGQKDTEHLSVYLLADTGRANVIVTAENIYLNLTPADIYAVGDAISLKSAVIFTSPLRGAVHLADVRATGEASVHLKQPLRVAYIRGMDFTFGRVTLPGSLVYVDGGNSGISDEEYWYQTLYEDVRIPDVERYMTAYDAVDLTFEYSFPNGYTVLTDAAGKVISVTLPSGLVVRTSGYTPPSGVRYYTEQDVTFNIDTGRLELGVNAGEHNVPVHLIADTVTQRLFTDVYIYDELKGYGEIFAKALTYTGNTFNSPSLGTLYGTSIMYYSAMRLYTVADVPGLQVLVNYKYHRDEPEHWSFQNAIFGIRYTYVNADGDEVVFDKNVYNLENGQTENGTLLMKNGEQMNGHNPYDYYSVPDSDSLTTDTKVIFRGLSVQVEIDGKLYDTVENNETVGGLRQDVKLSAGDSVTLRRQSDDTYDVLGIETIDMGDPLAPDTKYFTEQDVYVNVVTGEVTLGANADPYTVPVTDLNTGLIGLYVDVYGWKTGAEYGEIERLALDMSTRVNLGGWRQNYDLTTLYAFELKNWAHLAGGNFLFNNLRVLVTQVTGAGKDYYTPEIAGILYTDLHGDEVYLSTFAHYLPEGGSDYAPTTQPIDAPLFLKDGWTVGNDGSNGMTVISGVQPTYKFWSLMESDRYPVTPDEKDDYENPFGMATPNCGDLYGKYNTNVLTALYLEFRGVSSQQASKNNGAVNTVTLKAGDSAVAKKSGDSSVNALGLGAATRADAAWRKLASGVFYSRPQELLTVSGGMTMNAADIRAAGAVFLNKGQSVRMEYLTPNLAKVVSNDLFGAVESPEHIHPDWDVTVSHTYYIAGVGGYGTARVYKKFFPEYKAYYKDGLREAFDSFDVMDTHYADDSPIKITWLKISESEGVTTYAGFDGSILRSDGTMSGSVGVRYMRTNDGLSGTDGSVWSKTGALVTAPPALGSRVKRIALSGGDAYISMLAGVSVRIAVVNADARLLDGDAAQADGLDIRASVLRYVMPAGVQIGPDNPLEIECFDIKYLSPAGVEIAPEEINFTLYIEDGDLTLTEDILRSTGAYSVRVQNGTLTVQNDIIVSGDAALTLYAGRDLIFRDLIVNNHTGLITLTALGELSFRSASVTGGGKANLTGGSVDMSGGIIMDGDGSLLDIRSATGDLMITQAISLTDKATLKLKGEQNLTFYTLTADNASASALAYAGNLTGMTVASKNKATAEITAYGDVDLYGSIYSGGSLNVSDATAAVVSGNQSASVAFVTVEKGGQAVIDARDNVAVQGDSLITGAGSKLTINARNGSAVLHAPGMGSLTVQDGGEAIVNASRDRLSDAGIKTGDSISAGMVDISGAKSKVSFFTPQSLSFTGPVRMTDQPALQLSYTGDLNLYGMTLDNADYTLKNTSGAVVVRNAITLKNGSDLTLESANGAVSAAAVAASGGSTALITALGDLTTGNLTASGVGSLVKLTSTGGALTTGDATASDKGRIELNAKTDATLGTLTAGGGGALSANVQEDLSLDDFIMLEGAGLTIVTASGDLTLGSADVADGSAYITGGSVSVGVVTQSGEDSFLKLISQSGDVSVDQSATLDGGAALVVTAYNDFHFNHISLDGATLNANAAGGELSGVRLTAENGAYATVNACGDVHLTGTPLDGGLGLDVSDATADIRSIDGAASVSFVNVDNGGTASVIGKTAVVMAGDSTVSGTGSKLTLESYMGHVSLRDADAGSLTVSDGGEVIVKAKLDQTDSEGVRTGASIDAGALTVSDGASKVTFTTDQSVSLNGLVALTDGPTLNITQTGDLTMGGLRLDNTDYTLQNVSGAVVIDGDVTLVNASDLTLGSANHGVSTGAVTATGGSAARLSAADDLVTGDVIADGAGSLVSLTSTAGAVTTGAVSVRNDADAAIKAATDINATGLVDVADTSSLTLNASGDIGGESAPVAMAGDATADIRIIGADDITLAGDITRDALRVSIDRMTGALNVSSPQDIDITLQNGGLTLGAIGAANAALTAKKGGISTGTDGLISARVITLTADGNIGASDAPLAVEQIGESPVGAIGTGDAGILNIQTPGDAYISEQTGDLGLGVLTAANAAITAPGSIVNRLTTVGQTNAAMTGTLRLTASNGDLGASDRALTLDVAGLTTLDFAGDAFIEGQNDQNLVALADGADSLNYAASGDLTLTTGETPTGLTVEADGKVRVIAGGDVTVHSLGAGGDVDIQGDGDVTASNIDADGDADIQGDGDVTVSDVDAGGDASVSAGGMAVIGGLAAAGQADISAAGISGVGASDTPDISAQGISLDAGDQLIGSSDAPLSIAAGDDGLTASGSGMHVSQTGDDLLLGDIDILGDAVIAAQAGIQSLSGTVRIGGDADLSAGGDIGAAGAPLDLDVAGAVTASGDSVNLHTPGDLAIGGITANDATLSSGGNMTAQDGVIDAADVTLEASGNIGSELNPVDTTAERINLTGGSADVNARGDVELGTVEIGDHLNLHGGGDITQTPGAAANVGDRINLNAAGDIGESANPIQVNAGSILAAGEDIYIASLSDTTDLEGVTGLNVQIDAAGNVTGGDIHADNLTINAQGQIGSAVHPLYVHVSGKNRLSSAVRAVFSYNYLAKKTHLRFLFSLRVPTADGDRLALLGVDEDGRLRLVGFYQATDDTAELARRILRDLYNQYVTIVSAAFTDGIDWLCEALSAQYGGIVFLRCDGLRADGAVPCGETDEAHLALHAVLDALDMLAPRISDARDAIETRRVIEAYISEVFDRSVV